MAFRAVHAQWGTVFAHLPDLGCQRGWEAVWKTRPRAPITCDECHHPMYAKTSRAGLRFFAHAPGAPTCALGLESVAHHLLKLELATAARDAGAHAELEVPGPDGAWRADVLATDPAGAWTTALEAQLAPITGADITARTEKMHADGVASIWFSDRPRPPGRHRSTSPPRTPTSSRKTADGASTKPVWPRCGPPTRRSGTRSVPRTPSPARRP
ncbi:competence protein CoiA family protein [Streptomyces angustmyceticus]